MFYTTTCIEHSTSRSSLFQPYRAHRSPSHTGLGLLRVVLLFPLHVLPLLAIQPAAPSEVHEVRHAVAREQPVVIVVAADVQVVDEPARSHPLPARHLHHLHDEGAGQVAHSEGHVQQRHAEAGHALGQLGVQELDLPDDAERLGEPHKRELRHEPERRDGDPALRQPPPLALHRRGDSRRRGGEEQAPTDALLHGEPVRVARVPLQCRRDPPVVAGRPQRHGGHVEDGQGAAGNAEPARADAPVHSIGLLNGEALVHGKGEEDGGGPDRQDADRRLELLHLVHRAQPRPVVAVPLGGRRRRVRAVAGRVVLGGTEQARLVQEPQLVRGDSELAVLEVMVHAIDGLVRQPRPVVPDRRGDGGAYPGEHPPLALLLDV